ncbi:ArsR/SmtB family transcription factor [Alkalithermobacter paradoxus]|uniref:Transcriptional repressor SdpR n=1 Tax=Alkalithermobacter paradoxus TaxID=29349 RepID=A0A1V4I7V7_9FIRM|nr:transcriptional repressor SdpR [[Clostridium] thermoalcaliphilum]
MEEKVEIFKALSDKNRLMILEMLSCGEMCACDIMEGLELTQPTISHHMKILQQSGLVNSQKKGKWVFYSINTDNIKLICEFIKNITSYKDGCICNKVKNKCIEE